jgi:hypothetical protein
MRYGLTPKLFSGYIRVYERLMNFNMGSFVTKYD